MKKLLLYFLFIPTIILVIAITYLNTKGYETEKFNKLIYQELDKKNLDIKIKLEKIRIKLDIKKTNLYLSTINPNIVYKEIGLPINNIKIYIDLIPLLKSRFNVNKIYLDFSDLEINQFKKLVLKSKPSNLKSFVLDNISNGKIKGDFEVNLTENFEIKSYNINGKIKNIDLKFQNNLKAKKTSFDFIASNDLLLINTLSSNFNEIPIKDGNISINRKKNIIIEGSILTNLTLNNKKIKQISLGKLNNNFFKNKINVSGKYLNKFTVKLSKTLELLDYSFTLEGDIKNASIIPNKKIDNFLLEKKIEKINFIKTKLKIDFNKNNKNSIFFEGKYNTDKKENKVYKKYKILSELSETKNEIRLDFNFDDKFILDVINYEKKQGVEANIKSEILFESGITKIKKFIYTENNNSIHINNIKLNKKNEIQNFKEIRVNTFNEKNVKNNSFRIELGKKIIVNGSKFDAKNLIKNINQKNKKNVLKKISKQIEINFEEVFTKESIPLSKFKLLGKIEKGEFIKISSKSEISPDKFLDISLNKDNNSNTKSIEVFSDIPKIILSDFSFFKGLEGGNLLFFSKFNKDDSNSSLKIENFKAKNAPGFAKLLALADFGGMLDMLSGDGISFDILEIKFNESSDVLNITELYAVGPSISILMDGYIENKTGLASLRGTMVPAKELNNLISKIPIIGKIIIPKDVGEGLFGISFKIKGKKGDMKTSVNPIKTLTPRFITKALEKRKN
ncbi:MAG: hypothetical protein FD547_000179 [Pelagibacterales bacterium]|nr:hypothetical protein [Pelagibacterales bacterium]